MMSNFLWSHGARLNSLRRQYFPNYTYLSSSSSHEECNSGSVLQSSLHTIGHECDITVGDNSRNQTVTSKEEKIDEHGSISTVVSYPITADNDIAEPARYVSNIKLNVSSILNRLGTNNTNNNNNNTGVRNTICLSLEQLPQLFKKFNKFNMNMWNDIKFNVSHLSDILTSLLEQSDDKVGALNEAVSLLVQIKSKLKPKATTIIMQQIFNHVVQQKWLKVVRDIDIESNAPHEYYCYSSYFNFLSLTEKLRFCLSLLHYV